MIILDTNVISEPLKPRADPAVAAWLDSQDADSLYLTAINLSELLVGVELLPSGKRKRGISAALEELLAKLFADRLLAFNCEAASAYALLISRAMAKGYVIGVADGQIAAIAAVHGFTIATRDIAPFRAAGVLVLNPWTSRL